MLDGIGPLTIKKLIEVCGSPEEIFNQTPERYKNIINPSMIEKLKKWQTVKWEEELQKAEKLGVQIICLDEPEYPEQLKQIPDPPFVLYIKGKIPKNLIFIAIVGTRNPSFYGATMAERFSSVLASSGFCIVSGLARGIDSIAHKATLKVKGKTIAILGSGLAQIYPSENKKLAEEISFNGAIISEFPLDTKPEKFNFPRRNRIISGMSKATVVIEAGLRSGALITAHHAVEQNKDVFVLPSDANRITGRGNNQLIKEGAFLVENPEEILEYFDTLIPQNVSITKSQQSSSFENLTETEKLVYNVIKGKTVNIEQICFETNIDISLIMQALTSLEIKGLIRTEPGKNYTDKETKF